MIALFILLINYLCSADEDQILGFVYWDARGRENMRCLTFNSEMPPNGYDFISVGVRHFCGSTKKLIIPYYECFREESDGLHLTSVVDSERYEMHFFVSSEATRKLSKWLSDWFELTKVPPCSRAFCSEVIDQ